MWSNKNFRRKVFFISNKNNQKLHGGIKFKGSWANNLKVKSNFKMTLRIVAFLICMIGFLYQISQLMSIYLSGKTSVDNRVERLKHSELPAITVCLPTFVSMGKFVEHLLKHSTNETLRQLYEDYHNFETQETNDQTEEKHLIIFRNLTHSIFLDLNVSLLNIFENIGHTLNLTVHYSIALNEQDEVINLTFPHIYESVVPFSDPRKCFTFFSGFDPNYRNKKFEVISLFLIITHDKRAFPISLYNTQDFHIILHSPNTLPDYRRDETFRSLKIGKTYAISYSVNHIQRLPDPYLTDCHNYDLDDLGQNDMRSDCIQKCVDNNLFEMFPEFKCISTYFNFKLIRKENLRNLSKYHFCNYKKIDQAHLQEFYKQQIKLETVCKTRCRNNCQDTFYDFTIGCIRSWSFAQNNSVVLTLQHSPLPDRIIIHRPVMSWIELVSNFGGLLGMWLGLSIAFLLDYLIMFI